MADPTPLDRLREQSWFHIAVNGEELQAVRLSVAESILSEVQQERERLRDALLELADEFDRLADRVPKETPVLHMPMLRARGLLGALAES